MSPGNALNRRSFIIAAAVAAPALLLSGPAAFAAAEKASAAGSAEELEAIRRKLRELSLNSASGGGVNVKLMPDASGELTVPLPETFSFDRHHAICRVDTNPEAFVMPTYAMGDVAIEANSFFMGMVATTIDEYVVTTESDDTRRVTLRGGLDCSTEVGQAETTLGSRSAAEHASYLIEAVDGGIGGGEAGDHFAFTVFFDAEEAPLNHSIFGPEFTFTGELVLGEITIVDPTINA